MIDFRPADHPLAKILVVDDNPLNLMFLEKLLAKSGYTEVTSTARPQDVENIAAFLDPDLVITDLHMPGVSGYAVLEQLRATPRSGYLPILVFTADVTGDARRRALDLGATDFLTKPGDPAEIILRVRNFLEMRFLYRQLEEQNSLLEEKVQERTKLLEEAQLEIVHRLALAGDYRDDDTGEHCRRVGDLSYAIALEYGLPRADAQLIRLAAPLHDIGKVAISDSILKKPGKLTEDEFSEIQQHTELGGRILANSRCAILQLAHSIAISHHERWDGGGYGQKLMGPDIPIAGRIVAVANVFDALTNKRPYKEPWPVDDAIAEIERNAGSQFDPDVVAAFLRVIALQEQAAA